MKWNGTSCDSLIEANNKWCAINNLVRINNDSTEMANKWSRLQVSWLKWCGHLILVTINGGSIELVSQINSSINSNTFSYAFRCNFLLQFKFTSRLCHHRWLIKSTLCHPNNSQWNLVITLVVSWSLCGQLIIQSRVGSTNPWGTIDSCLDWLCIKTSKQSRTWSLNCRTKHRTIEWILELWLKVSLN